MKLYNLILIATLFISTQLFGDFDPNQYRRYVTEINSSKYSEYTYLTLSDNTKWYFEKRSSDSQIIIGEEVFVSSAFKKGTEGKLQLNFSNLASYDSRNASLLSPKKESLPTVKEIHHKTQHIRVKKKKKRITTDFIELTDGSKWKYYDTNWKIGDPVFISFKLDSDYKKCTLINTNKTKTYITEQPDETGRISKWQYSYYYSEDCEPFLE